jgi:hypothetical protein
MATYNDFLGEGGTGVSPQKPYDPNDEPNPKNPGGVSNNELTRIVSSNKRAGVSLDPAISARASAPVTPRPQTANAPNDLGGDLARIGGFVGTALTNPIGLATRGHMNPIVNAALNPVGYAAGAVGDEALDQALPGGSGVYGQNIIPGVKGTGGDSFYPSETLQSGSYADGYRGIGNPTAVPRANPYAQDGRGAAAPPGAGGASAPPPQPATPARPDSYRSDAVTPQIQALLDAERRTGPSQAEALLTKATDRLAAQSLGIAAGARGGAGARERATRYAQSTNAAAGATASSDIAALRAKEDADSRARQQAIMELMSGNAEAGDARDLGYYSSDQARAGAQYNTEANIASNEREGAADREARAFEAQQARDLTRATFNANQSPGLLDDPLAWLTEAATGRKLRATRI